MNIIMIRYYIDTETTGLNHNLHEIIEICIIAEDLSGRVVGEFCKKIKPTNILMAEKEALEINGYTPEKWKDALQPNKELASTILNLLDEEGIWVGHNPYFDFRFLREFMRKYSGNHIMRYMPKLDTRQLAIALFWPDLQSFSLNSVRKSMGLGDHNPHNARSDAYICREIFHKFDRLKKG